MVRRTAGGFWACSARFSLECALYTTEQSHRYACCASTRQMRGGTEVTQVGQARRSRPPGRFARTRRTGSPGPSARISGGRPRPAVWADRLSPAVSGPWPADERGTSSSPSGCSRYRLLILVGRRAEGPDTRRRERDRHVALRSVKVDLLGKSQHSGQWVVHRDRHITCLTRRRTWRLATARPIHRRFEGRIDERRDQRFKRRTVAPIDLTHFSSSCTG